MGSLSADQLALKLKDIKLNVSEGEFIADSKVIENFLALELPVNSEVLDLCSENGHISASIQAQGFFKVQDL